MDARVTVSRVAYYTDKERNQLLRDTYRHQPSRTFIITAAREIYPGDRRSRGSRTRRHAKASQQIRRVPELAIQQRATKHVTSYFSFGVRGTESSRTRQDHELGVHIEGGTVRNVLQTRTSKRVIDHPRDVGDNLHAHSAAERTRHDQTHTREKNP